MAQATLDRNQVLDENVNTVDRNQISSEAQDTINLVELYAEIWTSVRETDQISFKLLSFVPLVSGSGAGLLVFLLDKKILGLLPIICLSLLSAVVTFGLYRWELRNIQTCSRLFKRATWLEQRLGFGDLAGREAAPRLLGRSIGKTQAEKIIYTASIIAWLVPIIVAFS
jgi:hypothetical protein